MKFIGSCLYLYSISTIHNCLNVVWLEGGRCYLYFPRPSSCLDSERFRMVNDQPSLRLQRFWCEKAEWTAKWTQFDWVDNTSWNKVWCPGRSTFPPIHSLNVSSEKGLSLLAQRNRVFLVVISESVSYSRLNLFEWNSRYFISDFQFHFFYFYSDFRHFRAKFIP